MCKVSIIIPTTCSKNREQCLSRAINSVLAQANVFVEIIVVVNGDGFDHDLYESLKTDGRLTVFYLAEGHVSKARYYGVVQSSNDYFAFLDDDDELLPNTLRQRFDALEANKDVSVAIFNGYTFNGQVDQLVVDDTFLQKVTKSIELSFFEKNMFGNPSGIFNKKNMDINVFDIELKYFELTYIFLKLIENRYRLIFINEVAYRYYQNTNMSASKSEGYMLALPDMLKEAISMDISDEIKNILKKKYITALNGLSIYFLNQKY